MQLFLLSAVIIALAMAGMAVGVLLSNRFLRGSCGGPDVLGPNGESLTCATCPNRDQPTEADPPVQTTL